MNYCPESIGKVCLHEIEFLGIQKNTFTINKAVLFGRVLNFSELKEPA